MNNAEIIKQIKKTDTETKVELKFEKFVIFKSSEKTWALPAEDVKEIVHDLTIYSLPFMPPYITGLINRYGQPHTVLDLNILLSQKPTQSDTFLILNIQDDSICIHCDDILEIAKLEQSMIIQINDFDVTDFTRSTFERNNLQVSVLKIDLIMEKLKNDLGK